MKKFMLRAIPVVLVALVVLAGPVFGAGVDQVMNMAEGNGIGTVNTAVSKVWSTVLTILQILAVAAIVFAGVKYMFASAEGKADIKNGMIGLVVGAILVFGASAIVKMILNASKEVTG